MRAMLSVLFLAIPLAAGEGDWRGVYLSQAPQAKGSERAPRAVLTERTDMDPVSSSGDALKRAERRIADLEFKLKALAEQPKLIPAGKPAAQDCPDGRCPAPQRVTFRSGDHNPSHTCPNCGTTSPAGTGTWVVRGWLSDGEHVHQCPNCGTSWRH